MGSANGSTPPNEMHTNDENVLAALIMVEFTREEIDRQRPHQLGQIRIVAVPVAEREAMPGIREKVPFQGPAVFEQARPQSLLNVDGRDMIAPAKKNK